MLHHSRPPEKESGPSFFGKWLRRVDGCDLDITFNDKAPEDAVTIDDVHKRSSEQLSLYAGREAVRGKVVLTPTGSSYSHSGIIIELVGTITMYEDDRKSEFLRQEKRYDADTVTQSTAFDFAFTAPKEYESYRGMTARVSYHVRAIVQRSVKNITGKRELWVTRVDEALSNSQPDASEHIGYFRENEFGPDSIAMEVGVDNSLHIEFRYDKKVFHLSERVLGKVTFKVANMDIEGGEVGIVRKEYHGVFKPGDDITRLDPAQVETLQKFEIMDGTPIVGEVVPIRLYLGCIPTLTPTYENVHNCFHVRYFLNLVLITENGKRYFKQREITLYRRRGQDVPTNVKPHDAL